MRKFYCLLLIVLLCFPSLALGEENLLKNADFEAVDAGLPADWFEDAYYMSTTASSFALEADGYSGSCIRVTNLTENDARFMQTVSVEPDTTYKITCLCRAEGVPEGSIGATISIKDTFSYSESLTDTNGEWVPLTLYGKTGSDQTTLTVYARVGGYGNLNTGTAWFDNFGMVAVDSVPADVSVTSFATRSSQSSLKATTTDADAEPARNHGGVCTADGAVCAFADCRCAQISPHARKKRQFLPQMLCLYVDWRAFAAHRSRTARARLLFGHQLLLLLGGHNVLDRSARILFRRGLVRLSAGIYADAVAGRRGARAAARSGHGLRLADGFDAEAAGDCV